MAAPAEHIGQAGVDRDPAVPLVRTGAGLDNRWRARDVRIEPLDCSIVFWIPPAHVFHAIQRESLGLHAAWWRLYRRPDRGVVHTGLGSERIEDQRAAEQQRERH